MRISDWSSDVCSSDRDSYTIGEGVAPADRWPVQLAQARRAGGVMLGDPKIIATTGWTTDELSAALDVFDASKASAPALVGAAEAASSSPGIPAAKLAASAAPTRSKAGSDSWDLTSLLIRSEEHTSEHQSLMRISYAVFC